MSGSSIFLDTSDGVELRALVGEEVFSWSFEPSGAMSLASEGAIQVSFIDSDWFLEVSVGGEWHRLLLGVGFSGSGSSEGSLQVSVDGTLLVFAGGAWRGAEQIYPDFQLVFEVDNPGTKVSIPLRNGVNVEIDWGDGVTTSHTSNDPSHTYAVPGTYTVSASGSAGQLGAGASNHPGWNQYVTKVLHWGGLGITSMSGAFYGCQKLVEVPKALPSGVTNMSNMFRVSSFNGDISSWDVSSVTDMNSMFSVSLFNGDISKWDVSSVTDMNSMFASSSFNQDISSWDVSSVMYMYGMFWDAPNFSQDLSGWCVTNIPSKPSGFDDNSGLQPHQLPIWGTCP